MGSVPTVQDKNFSGDGQEFEKVSRADEVTESHLH